MFLFVLDLDGSLYSFACALIHLLVYNLFKLHYLEADCITELVHE